ncbi:uncharacterized protein Z520_04654 [Fonsecaea multimorphosa CBS 102226]|uniref:FAD-binding PCMH-type domain-containing protein n=1 Tax=Fonsecaea multimorphosa CBS 102226 TaxID=1442371 RepID=A0A0D2HDQ1_9EURO|nr:uncharacterized protein Z520_04654 [Fonsecaea multimorphosa CBS 102226]KIY00016.1 hypothetical protein Z520_04654 [Fonsecaea multimorphosa CBS 102226]
MQESSLVPACIVSPLWAQSVSTAVSILSENDCPFAIRGQTHAPAAGFANIDGGVTLDMTSLASVSLNADRSVVSVGAGSSWLSVYSYLDPFNLTVAGGRNGAVGVGGLTLGGGISHFTARVGWACDNVVNFQVVLASGALVDVNATSHPLLFRALKGGGNNFGVVTRFDLATIPQGDISVTTLSHAVAERDSVFDAFTNLTTASPFDPYISLVTGLLFNATSKAWTLSNSAVYTAPNPDPPAFRGLKAIPSLSNTTRVTNLSAFANETPTPPLNWLFWTGTYAASTSLMSQTFDTLNTSFYNFTVPGGVVWSIAFEPLPTIISSYASAKGGNSLGTSPADGNAYILLISALWPNRSSNSVVEQTARSVGAQIDALAAGQGMLHRFRYLNYADPSQSPLRSFGPQNFARLTRASRAYDPQGVFQNNVPGGFKLV